MKYVSLCSITFVVPARIFISVIYIAATVALHLKNLPYYNSRRVPSPSLMESPN